MPNFKSQGFKIKEIYTSFVCLLLLGHLLVQVTWWFLASDGIEIQASVEDFRPPYCQTVMHGYILELTHIRARIFLLKIMYFSGISISKY